MILIDSSAGSRDLIKYPPLDDPSIACLSNLSISDDTKSSVDICFAGNGPNGKLTIGVEFKKLTELLSSIFSGRIQDTQIPAMKAEYDVCWLLYCGPYRCGDDDYLEIPQRTRTGLQWRQYDLIGNRPMKFGFLESSLLSYHEAGVYHKHVYDMSQAAKWIGCLYRWWSKPYSSHKSFRLFDRSSDLRRPAIMPGVDKVTRSIMDFADRIPGIDYERASRIASHFSSVIEMINADEKEWMKIDGIGKTLARVAVNTFREEKGKKVTPPQTEIKITSKHLTDLFT